MLTEKQHERYARQILLTEVGEAGQERLLGTSVGAEVGPDSAAEVAAIVYLAAAGVGRIVLGDRAREAVTADEVTSGLAYGIGDVGRPRIDAIRDRIRAINPDVSVEVGAPEEADARLPAANLPTGADLAMALARGCTTATGLLPALFRGSR